MDELRESDPERENIRAVMGQWRIIFGLELVTAADAIAKANERHQTSGGAYEFANSELREALAATFSTVSTQVEPSAKRKTGVGRNRNGGFRATETKADVGRARGTSPSAWFDPMLKHSTRQWSPPGPFLL
jgi:hypothetical protein